MQIIGSYINRVSQLLQRHWGKNLTCETLESRDVHFGHTIEFLLRYMIRIFT